VAASLQRSDHLALMGDVPFPAMEKAFSLSKKPLQCGAVHGDSVAARSTPGPFFCPWNRFGRWLLPGGFWSQESAPVSQILTLAAARIATGSVVE
jgi:hypothetical protein